ncbi:HNH endonuclease [Salipiger sp. CCB-MM3]|uniref:HNH endonuclease n=1 Tax=Salipiger sp. CCB-MM3 TaxID=1792508 RepID=UPI0009F58BFB|nr:HNH endonuclease signature motif containing protein [Salipiger sp. CCB-MM3]
MALSDITAQSVLLACDEYDQLGKTRFLDKYGFQASRTYHILKDGRSYDSKAIVGAAHGHLGKDFEPLVAAAFSGGLKQTVHVLENLGFSVVVDPPPTRNPDWTRDELILAAEFYRQHAPRIPGKATRALIELSNNIRAAATMQGLEGNSTFRNPNGVYMKLMEFRKYDDAYAGVGLGRSKSRDIELEAFTLPDVDLMVQARAIRQNIAQFLASGGEVPVVKRPPPHSEVLRELLASEDPVKNRMANALVDWQEVKRGSGRFAGLGREPGQIRKHGALHVIEQRVKSQASGFDEVSSAPYAESYEQIVVDYPERFAPEVVEIARSRLAKLELAAPTEDRGELAKKAAAILEEPELLSTPPAGNLTPTKKLAAATVFVRDPRVVAYTQRRANGACELCESDAPFQRADGTPYLETHHILPLVDGGPDTVDNCAAICPNCHRALHSAANREELTAKLKGRIVRAR